MFQHSVAVLILLLILSFQSICAKLFLISLKLLTFSKTPSRLLNFCFFHFMLMLKCSWLIPLLPNGFYFTTLSTNYFCENSTMSNTLAAQVFLMHVQLENYPVPDIQSLGILLCLMYTVCSGSYLIFPSLNSPIIIQSPLLASLIAFMYFFVVLFDYVGTTI